MVNLVDQQLGNYRLLSLIGQGGFADVYLGEHLHLGTRAAIKVLQIRVGSTGIEQFRTEARTIASLVHPHIVRVLDFGVQQDIPFLVMDYAPGGSLRQRYPEGSLVPVASIISYTKQIAAALQHAHDQHFIHRDVKPGNMLLLNENTLLLSDFGLVKVAHDSNSYSIQGVAGTAAYIAPEQIQGRPHIASDQYALGAIVYEWLSGTLPFQGSPIEIYGQHLHATPPSLHEIMPAISLETERIVLRALAKDPSQRFPRIEDFAKALEQAYQNMGNQLTVSDARPAFYLPTTPKTLESDHSPLYLPGRVSSQFLPPLPYPEGPSSHLSLSHPAFIKVKTVLNNFGMTNVMLIALTLLVVLASMVWFFSFALPRLQVRPLAKSVSTIHKNPGTLKMAPSSTPAPPPGITFTLSPTAVSWGPNRLDLFGRGSDGAIYHSYWDGSWHSFETLGGNFIYGVAASSWVAGRLDVFAIGTDGAIYHNYWDGSWHGWGDRLGGAFTSAPAAVSSGPNHIDVFGRGTDNAIWHTYWDGSWHAFDSLGGSFVSAPSVSSWGGGRLDVFAVGTDSGLYHNYWDGTWHGWGDRLSVTFTSTPAATSWGVGRIDVFAQNSDNTIWHVSWNGTAWSAPESLGGNFATAPAATSWAAGRLDVFDTGVDSALYHNYWDGNWHGWNDRID
ncbi:MAG: protein kinase [Ktedonobacteraceae bacterium]|nr:protein kinase [Ktedonobacteraceae bacterium]